MYEDLKEKLVNGGRALALEGQGDYVAGHITVRLPDDPGKFLMMSAGIGVSMMPGASALTRMPRGASDLDNDRVSPTSAPLAIE